MKYSGASFMPFKIKIKWASTFKSTFMCLILESIFEFYFKGSETQVTQQYSDHQSISFDIK